MIASLIYNTPELVESLKKQIDTIFIIDAGCTEKIEGSQINLLQTNTGQVTVAGAGGVTVNGTPGLKFRAQWSGASLIKRSTDGWVLVGDVSA